jgi:hypothetical protein
MVLAGAMVIMMREDSVVLDLRLCKDINLEAYRDATFGGRSEAMRGLQGSLAQLLFVRLNMEHGRRVCLWEKYGVDGTGTGSVLVVDQRKHEVEEEEVWSMCRVIGDVAIPLMREETVILLNSRLMITEAVRAAGDKYTHVTESDNG